MEINFLDYEKVLVTSTKPDEESPIEDSGLVQYDPIEKKLLFYDSEKKVKKYEIFVKEIKAIKETLLNENILAFDTTSEDKKNHLIKIYYGKKDVGSSRSFKLLCDIIIEEISEMERRQNKILNDIIPCEPKEYQKELLEKAKQKNTIVFSRRDSYESIKQQNR